MAEQTQSAFYGREGGSAVNSRQSTVTSLQSTVSSPQSYIELGIPEEWVAVLQELGYDSIAKLAEVEKHTKLHQELMGFRKKKKLDIGTVSPEEVREWLEKL